MDKDIEVLKDLLGHEPSLFEMMGYKLWQQGNAPDEESDKN